MNHIFLQTFDERWAVYLDELKTCREEFSEEAVHDLRVAARRLLAVIDMGRVIDPHPRLQKARRVFKNQIDELDDLRDTQVMLAELSERIQEFTALRPVQAQLQSDEKKLLRQARKEIKSFRLPEARKRLRKIRAELEAYPESEALDRHVLQAVDRAFGTVVQRYHQLDSSDPATIHRLRLSFKKFRYMVEMAHLALPDFPGEQLKRMHEYQAAMGEIQDMQTFLDALDDYADQNTGAAESLESVRRFYRQAHTDSIAAFMDDKGEILTFWRSGPEEPFPWEATRPGAQPATEPQ